MSPSFPERIFLLDGYVFPGQEDMNTEVPLSLGDQQ
jgi:hypothetical protein